MNYNWPQILESKTDIDLFMIFNGDNVKEFDARICAGQILAQRNFDKEKLLKTKENYLQKLSSEIYLAENTDRNKLKRKNKINRTIYLVIYGVFSVIVLLGMFNENLSINPYFSFLILFLLILISIFPLFREFKTRRKLMEEFENDLNEKKVMKERLINELKI